MEIFYREKAFHAGEKMKNAFAPSEKEKIPVTPLKCDVPSRPSFSDHFSYLQKALFQLYFSGKNQA